MDINCAEFNVQEVFQVEGNSTMCSNFNCIILLCIACLHVLVCNANGLLYLELVSDLVNQANKISPLLHYIIIA